MESLSGKCLKANVDVARNKNAWHAKIGAIVHDHEGMVQARFGNSLEGAFDAPFAEALAIIWHIDEF